MLLKECFMSDVRNKLSWSKNSDAERGEILLFLLLRERTGRLPVRGSGGKSLPTAD